MNKVLKAIAAAALCLSLSACSSQNTAEQSNLIHYSYKNESIDVQNTPKRILTLTSPLLNMAYAIGGSSIARPFTTVPIPPEAESLPQIGHVQNINVEQLISMKPDLVIGEKSQSKKLENLLESNHIPHIFINYDGINDNIPLIQFLGQIYGKEDRAKELINKYQTDLQAIEDKATAQNTPAKVAVLRATGKSVTAETPQSICASMTELLKMNNVITAHKELPLEDKTVPYSLEQLAADDPDIIFIVTMGKIDSINQKLNEEMRSNPAWNHLRAVQNDKVYFLPNELFLMNPGLRTPEALEKLYELAYGE